MAFVCRPSEFSSSKQRRLRAAATKQRLYVAAKDAETIKLIQSQLAMLTCFLDHFMWYFSSAYAPLVKADPLHMDTSAGASAPRECTPVHCKTGQTEAPRAEASEQGVYEEYASTCDKVADSIRTRRDVKTVQAATWEPLPAQFKMKRYSFKVARPAQVVVDTQVEATGAWIRVQWPCTLELAADDVLDHFGVFGNISDMEWLDVEGGKETIKLYFESRESISECMKSHKHSIRRESGSKVIEVRTSVKFSDNVAGEMRKKT